VLFHRTAPNGKGDTPESPGSFLRPNAGAVPIQKAAVTAVAATANTDENGFDKSFLTWASYCW
jgi:hypothetical protein